MIRAGDLKRILEGFPDDAPVVLASPRGTKFRALATHSDALVDMDDPDGQWHDASGEDSGMDDEEWGAFCAMAKRILILWPRATA